MVITVCSSKKSFIKLLVYVRGQTPPGYLQAIKLAMKLPAEEGGPCPINWRGLCFAEAKELGETGHWSWPE